MQGNGVYTAYNIQNWTTFVIKQFYIYNEETIISSLDSVVLQSGVLNIKATARNSQQGNSCY